jgi:hypothetical protein
MSYCKFFTFESSASKPHIQKLGPNFSEMVLYRNVICGPDHKFNMAAHEKKIT